jgi:hypothetical protein
LISVVPTISAGIVLAFEVFGHVDMQESQSIWVRGLGASIACTAATIIVIVFAIPTIIALYMGMGSIDWAGGKERPKIADISSKYHSTTFSTRDTRRGYFLLKFS